MNTHKFKCNYHSKIILLLSAAVLILNSCGKDEFKIKGEIYGGEEKSIVLEKADFQGNWVELDSVKINKNGGFSMSFPAPASPDIYRLKANQGYIYFPVDSTETITVTASYDKFGRDFNLEGSSNARRLGEFEKELQGLNSIHPDSLDAFKRKVYTSYMKDFPGSIVSFYILTKTIDGKPLYNPLEDSDRKYFGAVATGYQQARPEDPHAALLEQTAIQAMRQRNSELGKYREVEANELSLIEIELPDEKGQNVKLSDIAGKGKPVVVVFSLLNVEDSPELNIGLAKIYNRKGGNVEFYNVSLDEDQYAWREAATNLPWVTVYSPEGINSPSVREYNVYQVPSFYIYNAQGELISRPLTLEELDKSL